MNKEDSGDELGEQKLGGEEVFTGNLLRLSVDTVELASGQKTSREVVHHPGGVVVIPLFYSGSEAEVVLVKQYRYPAGKGLWELPAGTLEEEESPEACARRELLEETGYGAGSLRKLVDLYTSPGYTDEVLSLYIADELKDVDSSDVDSPEDENIVVEKFPVEELFDRAKCGEITDGKTLAGLFYLSFGKEYV